MHANHQQVIDALNVNPDPLIAWAAERLVALGAKSEWSMDDNFATTESLAALDAVYRLPNASDQDDDALRFYGEAAQALGYPADIDDWDNEDDEDDEDGAPSEQWEVTTPNEVYDTDDSPGDLLGGAKR